MLCFVLQKSGKFGVPKHCDTKMPMVSIIIVCVEAYVSIHTAWWASVLLFGTKGNTRALKAEIIVRAKRDKNSNSAVPLL